MVASFDLGHNLSDIQVTEREQLAADRFSQSSLRVRQPYVAELGDNPFEQSLCLLVQGGRVLLDERFDRRRGGVFLVELHLLWLRAEPTNDLRLLEQVLG